MELNQDDVLEKAVRKLEAAAQRNAATPKNSSEVAAATERILGCCELRRGGRTKRRDGVTEQQCQDAAAADNIDFDWNEGRC